MSDGAIDIPKGPLTVDEFEAWVTSLPKEAGRFELSDGYLVRMQSERLSHSLAKAEVGFQFQSQIRTKSLDCTYFPDRMAIAIADNNWFEPDGFVFCGALPTDDPWKLTDATVIIEIEAPGKSRVSAVSKMRKYFENTSVEHFLAIELAERTITHFRRRDGDPIYQIAAILRGGELALDPPGLSLDFDAVFSAVDRSVDDRASE